MAPFGDYQQHGQLMLQESAATSMVDLSTMLAMGAILLIFFLAGALIIVWNWAKTQLDEVEDDLNKLQSSVTASSAAATPTVFAPTTIAPEWFGRNVVVCDNTAAVTIPATPVFTMITPTSTADCTGDVILAAGTYPGQIKVLTKGGANAKAATVKAGTTMGATVPNTITFKATDTEMEYVTLVWNGSMWEIVSSYGANQLARVA